MNLGKDRVGLRITLMKQTDGRARERIAIKWQKTAPAK